MTNRAFLTILNDLHKKELSILEARAERYSQEDDRMHNFKRISDFLKRKPPMVALCLMMKHFIALQDWLAKYDKSEHDGVDLDEFKQLEEFVIDIRNYLALIYAMLFENVEPDE